MTPSETHASLYGGRGDWDYYYGAAGMAPGGRTTSTHIASGEYGDAASPHPYSESRLLQHDEQVVHKKVEQIRGCQASLTYTEAVLEFSRIAMRCHDPRSAPSVELSKHGPNRSWYVELVQHFPPQARSPDRIVCLRDVDERRVRLLSLARA